MYTVGCILPDVGDCMNPLGDLLTRLREERELSLRAAARLIGISHEYLAILEGGGQRMTKRQAEPSLLVLKKIAKGYNVSYYELLSAADGLPGNIPPAILDMLADPHNRDIVRLMQDPEDFEVLVTNSRAILRHAEKVGRSNDKSDSHDD
jgi:transcriptional regulator with XRE-family HTH domain